MLARGLLPSAFTLLGLVMVALVPGSAPAHAGSQSTGAKGAQVYCFMRASGHPHELSWEAAYALMKRQSSGLFKTSPEHGAVMITETVVQNPEAFPECGRFLGDLYLRKTSGPAARMPTPTPPGETRPEELPMTRSERYGY